MGRRKRNCLADEGEQKRDYFEVGMIKSDLQRRRRDSTRSIRHLNCPGK